MQEILQDFNISTGGREFVILVLRTILTSWKATIVYSKTSLPDLKKKQELMVWN